MQRVLLQNSNLCELIIQEYFDTLTRLLNSLWMNCRDCSMNSTICRPVMNKQYIVRGNMQLKFQRETYTTLREHIDDAFYAEGEVEMMHTVLISELDEEV